MDSDDDLLMPPPPQPKASAAIDLDDSDDDLLAPAYVAPTPGGGGIVLDDSDDDLLPAPLNASFASPASPKATESIASPKADVASPKSTFHDPEAEKAALENALRDQKAYRRKDLHKEGFLFKQQPTWPYGSQKRWCVLDGRMFLYYDSQGATKPAASLDLKGAKIVTDMKDAKQPLSFGITNIQDGTSGQGAASSGAMKGRTFIFSSLNKETMNEWIDAIRSVLQEPASEVHWFEKLAQGSF